jgi:hypothetical protein
MTQWIVNSKPRKNTENNFERSADFGCGLVKLGKDRLPLQNLGSQTRRIFADFLPNCKPIVAKAGLFQQQVAPLFESRYACGFCQVALPNQSRTIAAKYAIEGTENHCQPELMRLSQRA